MTFSASKICAVGALLLSPHASAIQLTPARQEPNITIPATDEELFEPVTNDHPMKRQRLTNHHDTWYTGEIKVGGQKLDAILDTGSFELVVLSRNCKTCGPKRGLYFGSKSDSFGELGIEGSITYGSGTAYTRAVFDQVDVMGLKVEKQEFWQVEDADAKLSGIFGDSHLGAIFGVGPPSSIVKFATDENDDLQHDLKKYKKDGGRVTPAIEKQVQNVQDAVTLAKETTTFLDKLDIRDLSVCLGRRSGSPGYFSWNDDIDSSDASKFINVPLAGDYYWSAKLADVAVGKGPQNDRPFELGCFKRGCSGVIDTGTTLIAAPRQAYYAVENLLSSWEAQGGGCNDLSLLPNLEFKLHGKKLTLPPEAYVVQYKGNSKSLEEKKHLFPGLHEKHSKAKKTGSQDQDNFAYCASLLSPMDADSQNGDLWILGMALFREYYTVFHLKDRSRVLVGSSLSFSRASDECTPGSHPDMLSSETLFGKSRPSRLSINISDVRVSSLQDKVLRMSNNKTSGNPQMRVVRGKVPELQKKPFIHV